VGQGDFWGYFRSNPTTHSALAQLQDWDLFQTLVDAAPLQPLNRLTFVTDDAEKAERWGAARMDGRSPLE